MKKTNLSFISRSLFSGVIVLGCTTQFAMASTGNTSTESSTLQNLMSLGTASTTVTGSPDATFTKYEQNYPGPITGATGWAGFCHQSGRYVTVQFPSAVDVQHIEITMRQNASSGIYYPNEVQFEAYSNGQWYLLKSQRSSNQSTSTSSGVNTDTTQTFQFDNTTGIETNSIRIYFPVDIWVFANGLKVSGSTTTLGDFPTPYVYPIITPNTSWSGALAPSDAIANIHNMLLVETGGYGDLGTWSTADFSPMLAYVNPMGYQVSSMFDTILFLPYANVQDTLTGWTAYMDDLFSENQQLGALNQAVASLNQTMNRPGYKEKVILNIPYFPFGGGDFGSINGQDVQFNGSAADPNAVTARSTALNWYVNTLLNRWNAERYQNLQLVGLYWNGETYKDTSPGEQDVLGSAEQLVHNNNLPLFWIPFYGATGSTNWNSLGFNAAWLQPNFVEQGANADVSRIDTTAALTKEYNMGVEVELTGLDDSNRLLYDTSLKELRTDGLGGSDVSHAFYDGSKLLLQSEQSTDPNVRSIYDDTFSFMMIGQN